MDTAFWTQITDNDYALPQGHSLDSLTQELFGYLASPDPQLRLAFAYVILEQWIREKNLYTDAQLNTLIDELLPNLRKGIGDSGTDSIFLRSFSIWILAFILQRDLKVPFVAQSKFTEIVDSIAEYAHTEQDLRGWVEGKGWAHAGAHIASILGVIAQNHYADVATHERILTIIAEFIIRQTDHVFQYGEDDRMAQTVSIILGANLVDITFLHGWLKRLQSIMELASEGMPFDIKILNAYMNTRNLVRAVYYPIELCMPDKPAVWEDLRPVLLESIKEIGLC